jgi:ribonuclease BN (tRNA processing enzyme)
METFYPGSSAVGRRFDLEIVELDGVGGIRAAGPLTVSSWEVDHASGAPALAVRIRLGDIAFAYSGDTAWTNALVAVPAGADVFACEAYTFDRPVRYHLDYRTLRKHVDELDTNRLVRTHMGPSTLARLAELDHEAADDGLVVRA